MKMPYEETLDSAVYLKRAIEQIDTMLAREVQTVINHAMRAYNDPGQYTPRGDNYTEALGHWQERARTLAMQAARAELAGK
jgi:hypothetical protein